MEILLNNIAKKATDILDKKHQCTELERLQIYLGLQNLIYNVIITSLILFLSHITGNLLETLLIFVVFGIFRIIVGGYHFNSCLKCITITTFIMVGGGKFIQLIEFRFSFCIAICIFLNIIFFLYTPLGTVKNPYSKEYSLLQKKRLKIISCIFTTIVLLTPLRSIIVFAMSLVAILLIPNWLSKFQKFE